MFESDPPRVVIVEESATIGSMLVTLLDAHAFHGFQQATAGGFYLRQFWHELFNKNIYLNQFTIYARAAPTSSAARCRQ